VYDTEAGECLQTPASEYNKNDSGTVVGARRWERGLGVETIVFLLPVEGDAATQKGVRPTNSRAKLRCSFHGQLHEAYHSGGSI